MNSIIVASCQAPYIKNNPEKALELMINYSSKAEEDGAKIICFPECFLQGYELNIETRKLGMNLSSIQFRDLLEGLKSIQLILVFGLIEIEGKNTFNTAVVIQRGKLLGKYRKNNLIGIERSIFNQGSNYPVFEVDGLKFGINICYDLNFSASAEAVSNQDAKLLICPSNNMLENSVAEKWKLKHNSIRSQRCIETGLWLISSDVTGRIDGKVSYGPTAVINPKGKVVKQLPLMQPGLLIHEVMIN
ncbi:MAG: carbon-nitrogen hydrolase family protein [Bdellovibrionaceae bacterium]|jgi:predicted amidohydrolase|nr:carbon-nitrogen hydrolase family protein [Pseudobdellovibrionaceae bacterium]